MGGLRWLADDRCIVTKQVDKGSCVVVWCRDDCIKEPNKQLEDETVYTDVDFKETILWNLVDKSNRILKSLYRRKFITKKELKYFSYDFKKTINLEALSCTWKTCNLQLWNSNRESMRVP